jgi:DNA-binding CsgD family transcriptional regulator
VWLWNTRLRHLDPTIIANARQRQRVIAEAFTGELNLDRRLVDHIVVALAAEVTAIVGRAPELAGMPVEMPRPHGVRVGPEWELDEHGHAQAWIAIADWANADAADLIRRVYKHARRNLLDWAFGMPRLKAAREAAKVSQGEIEVTAQRRRPPKALEYMPSWPSPEAIAEGRSMLSALFDAASPREHEILNFLVQGHSDTDVAAVLGCQRHVVYSHRHRLWKKLQALQR